MIASQNCLRSPHIAQSLYAYVERLIARELARGEGLMTLTNGTDKEN